MYVSTGRTRCAQRLLALELSRSVCKPTPAPQTPVQRLQAEQQGIHPDTAENARRNG